MPIRQLDRAAIRREARELIRTARVSPIKFTLLFLAVSLALSLLDTALTSLTGRIVGVAFVSVSFVSILIGLITQVLDAGYKCYCLGVHRREEMPYESVFDGFTFAGKVIALYIVEGFFVAREAEENHALVLPAPLLHYLFHLGHMLVTEGQMLCRLIEGDILHIEHQSAPQLG